MTEQEASRLRLALERVTSAEQLCRPMHEVARVSAEGELYDTLEEQFAEVRITIRSLIRPMPSASEEGEA